MAIVTGTLAGTLLAGGLYYAFSDMIRYRTQVHERQLHLLSHQMRGDTADLLMGPPTAASRIRREQPFSDMLKERWNRQIAQIFQNTSNVEDSIRNWSERNILGGSKSIDTRHN